MHKIDFVSNLCLGKKKRERERENLLGFSCTVSIFLSEFNRI